MNTKIAMVFVAMLLSFSSFGCIDKQRKLTTKKYLVSDSTQYWKSKAKLFEQQSLNMVRLNAEEAKRQHQAQMECLKQSETLQELIDQQKKEIEQLKKRKP